MFAAAVEALWAPVERGIGRWGRAADLAQRLGLDGSVGGTAACVWVRAGQRVRCKPT